MLVQPAQQINKYICTYSHSRGLQTDCNRTTVYITKINTTTNDNHIVNLAREAKYLITLLRPPYHSDGHFFQVRKAFTGNGYVSLLLLVLWISKQLPFSRLSACNNVQYLLLPIYFW